MNIIQLNKFKWVQMELKMHTTSHNNVWYYYIFSQFDKTERNNIADVNSI